MLYLLNYDASSFFYINTTLVYEYKHISSSTTMKLSVLSVVLTFLVVQIGESLFWANKYKSFKPFVFAKPKIFSVKHKPLYPLIFPVVVKKHKAIVPFLVGAGIGNAAGLMAGGAAGHAVGKVHGVVAGKVAAVGLGKVLLAKAAVADAAVHHHGGKEVHIVKEVAFPQAEKRIVSRRKTANAGITISFDNDDDDRRRR